MKNKNQMCQNEARRVVPIPAKVVANIVGCSESAVHKVRNGHRSEKSKVGFKITRVEDLLDTCIEVAINNISELVRRG